MKLSLQSLARQSKNSKDVPVHVIKVYKGRRGTAPLNLNLDIRRK